MTTALIKYYIDEHPKEAAPIIDNANPDVMVQFLQGLQPETRANLINHLLPNTVRHYLLAAQPTAAAQTLELFRPNSIATLLHGLSPPERGPILECWTDEKSETVRHQLRYPRDSVGSILITPTPACRDTSTVRHAKRIVRRLAASEASVVVVLDDDMRPVGLLDFSQLLRLREREIVGQHMRRVARPVRARAEMRVVAEHSAWTGEDFLPAVGSDDQFVGLIYKAQLLNHLAAQRASADPEDQLMTTIVALGELFWKPAAEFISTAMTATRGE